MEVPFSKHFIYLFLKIDLNNAGTESVYELHTTILTLVFLIILFILGKAISSAIKYLELTLFKFSSILLALVLGSILLATAPILFKA